MYWIIFCKNEILLTVSGELPQSASSPLDPQDSQHVLDLKLADGEPVKAYMLDQTPVLEGYKTIPLRQSFDLLTASQYQVAGKAYELLFWDSTTKFCGVCGAPTKWDTEISKRCTACQREYWPSPAPAIIVRITRKYTDPLTAQAQEEVLLVRAKDFKGDYYGLVAGFVETGENLEACVRREVLEETGLSITNLKYFGSQAWPYPFGLMLGFTAEYESGTLKIQKEELLLGDWFGKNSLPQIPGKASLARKLIDAWLEE